MTGNGKALEGERFLMTIVAKRLQHLEPRYSQQQLELWLIVLSHGSRWCVSIVFASSFGEQLGDFEYYEQLNRH